MTTVRTGDGEGGAGYDVSDISAGYAGDIPGGEVPEAGCAVGVQTGQQLGRIVVHTVCHYQRYLGL